MTDVVGKNNLKISKMAGFDIFSGGKNQVLKRLFGFMDTGTGLWQVATVNPEFVMEARKGGRFLKILRSTGLNTVDGIGLVWAEEVVGNGGDCCLQKRLFRAVWVGIKVLRGEYRHKISSGSELIVALCRIAKEKGWGVYFLGGFEDGARLTGKKIGKMVGDGLKYEASQGRPVVSDAQVLLSIQKFRPKILFVAYGMKKQEEWIYEHKNELEKVGVRIAMGVGRSFDYYSGKLAMAPDWLKRLGLEWLYSLIREPKRWKRQLALPKFIWQTLIDS